MFRFPVLGHLRRVERYAEIWKKDDFAKILSAWFYFVFAIKKNFSPEMCYLCIECLSISISSTTDNFDGLEYTDVVRKVEKFIILSNFHIVSATKVCNITIFYKMQI